MLVQFSVRNYKTFKDEAKLTLFASNYDKTTLEADNVFEVPKFGLRLLKSAVIYGANASGKTKLVEALLVLKQLVVHTENTPNLNIEPFLLSTETEHEPTEFEIIFIHEEEMYRYGLIVSKTKVHFEWLYQKPKTKEVELFYREGQSFVTHPQKFRKGGLVAKEGLIREDTLLLSISARFNENVSLKVVEWLRELIVGYNWDDNYVAGFSIGMTHENEDLRTKALGMLKSADIGIDEIRPKAYRKDGNHFFDGILGLDELVRYYNHQAEISKSPADMEIPDLLTEHKKYDAEKKAVGNVVFSLLVNESEGTRKYFAYSVPILESLGTGTPLIIDEFEAKLHPNLVKSIVELFNSAETNPNNAQLIFTTHDSNLLGEELFRRDQIWFIEKNRYGAANLYSLASFKTDEVRKKDNFEENYLKGKYGGVPVLGNFSSLFHHETIGEK